MAVLNLTATTVVKFKFHGLSSLNDDFVFFIGGRAQGGFKKTSSLSVDDGDLTVLLEAGDYCTWDESSPAGVQKVCIKNANTGTVLKWPGNNGNSAWVLGPALP